MKNIFILLVSVITIFSSCDFNKDFYDELDKEPKAEGIVIPDDYELIETDYKKVLDMRYPSFNNEQMAFDSVPKVLDHYYSANESNIEDVVNTTYAIYKGSFKLYKAVEYTVTDQDYIDGGSDYGSFKDYQAINFLEDKYPDAENHDLVLLDYTYYDGDTHPDTEHYYGFNEGSWTLFLHLSRDDYDTMGQSYPNFSSSDDADAKISIFLVDKLKYENKKEGDVENVIYTLRHKVDGSYVAEPALLSYILSADGVWEILSSTVDESFLFVFTKDLEWIADPTIRLTLAKEDYQYLTDNHEAFEVELGHNVFNEDATLNSKNWGYFAQYSNYDMSKWEEEDVDPSLLYLLENKLSTSPEVDESWKLTYKLYRADSDYGSTTFVYDGSNWIIN